jgi:outer membrane protein OmpA-like peptidoglycan-associated protein
MNKKIILAIALFVVTASAIAISQVVTTVVSLTGSVFDAVTYQPVSAILKVTDENGKTVNGARSNGAEDGYYYITGLEPGKTYYVELIKRNYFKEKYEIKLPKTNKYKEMSKDFTIKPKEKDSKIPLLVPPFERNKSKLRFGHEELLLDFQTTLLYNAQVKFEIVCFPDNNDDKAFNKKLTLERCESLKQYFMKSGVDESRITLSGNDKTDPDNPPPTASQAKGKRYIGTTYIVVKSF